MTLLAALDQVRERAAEEIEVQVEGNEAGGVGEHQYTASEVVAVELQPPSLSLTTKPAVSHVMPFQVQWFAVAVFQPTLQLGSQPSPCCVAS